jgi:hypothetical protein
MMAESGTSHGWCSLRLRFDERELQLLRGAERVRGAAMAQTGRSDSLRAALTLAKVGQKLGHSAPGASVVLDETELDLLLEAVRFAVPQVQAAARPDDAVAHRDSVTGAFPELVDKGAWRAFGLTRELETLAARLSSALKGS